MSYRVFFCLLCICMQFRIPSTKYVERHLRETVCTCVNNRFHQSSVDFGLKSRVCLPECTLPRSRSVPAARANPRVSQMFSRHYVSRTASPDPPCRNMCQFWHGHFPHYEPQGSMDIKNCGHGPYSLALSRAVKTSEGGGCDATNCLACLGIFVVIHLTDRMFLANRSPSKDVSTGFTCLFISLTLL